MPFTPIDKQTQRPLITRTFEVIDVVKDYFIKQDNNLLYRLVREFWRRVINDNGTLQDYNSALQIYKTNKSALLAVSPSATKAGKLYSVLPVDGSGDFTVTAANGTRINKDGLIQSVATNVPRINWLAGKPYILREAQATNQIRNNSMVGAVTGTPGTLPTNWSTTLRGLTRQIIAVGQINGVDYIELRFSGTANVTSDVQITLNETLIPATSGQNWVYSNWYQLITAPQPPNSYRLGFVEWTTGGVLVKLVNQTFNPLSTFTRISATRQLDGGATVGNVSPFLNYQVTNGQAYDFTIRIGMPQMELGTVPSSVIKTTTATETRDADIISVALPAGTAKVTTNFITGLPLVDNTPTTPYTMPVGEIESVIMED
jgi:hypothetical protein